MDWSQSAPHPAECENAARSPEAGIFARLIPIPTPVLFHIMGMSNPWRGKYERSTRQRSAAKSESLLDSNRKSGHILFNVKLSRYSEMKEQEAVRRAAVMRSQGTRTARQQQRRFSLVGDGSQWQITNLRQVSAAMAKWA